MVALAWTSILICVCESPVGLLQDAWPARRRLLLHRSLRLIFIAVITKSRRVDRPMLGLTLRAGLKRDLGLGRCTQVGLSGLLKFGGRLQISLILILQAAVLNLLVAICSPRLLRWVTVTSTVMFFSLFKRLDLTLTATIGHGLRAGLGPAGWCSLCKIAGSSLGSGPKVGRLIFSAACG